MAHKVYANPGIHAFASFDAAVEYAMRRGCIGAIMECPEGLYHTYATGWHLVVSEIDYYKSIGWLVRATTELVVKPVAEAE